MDKLLSPQIHQTAVVSPAAEIAAGTHIGPYVVIGEDVIVGADNVIGPHTVIEGPTVIGRGNHFVGHAVVGTFPQDLKYRGERSELVMGDENTIREFVTLNRGTEGGGGKTAIGNKNLLMTGVHVAHDCHIGHGSILANAATLGGHVTIADGSTVGAFSGVHQFCRVGPYAFIGGYSVITRDALPFVKTVGVRNQAGIYGINTLGLTRKNFSAQRIESLRKAYRLLFQKGLKIKEAIEEVRRQDLSTEDVGLLVRFIETSERGFVRRATESV